MPPTRTNPIPSHAADGDDGRDSTPRDLEEVRSVADAAPGAGSDTPSGKPATTPADRGALELAILAAIAAKLEDPKPPGRKIDWNALVAFVVAVLALGRTVYNTVQARVTAKEAQKEEADADKSLEAREFEYDLIRAALSSTSQEHAKEQLLFFKDLNFLPLHGNDVQTYLDTHKDVLPIEEPAYTPGDVNWFKGLSRSKVYVTDQPKRACNRVAIDGVKKRADGAALLTSEACTSLLDSGQRGYEGSIGGRYQIWWPQVFNEHPLCACTPLDAYVHSTKRAFLDSEIMGRDRFVDPIQDPHRPQ